MHDSLDDESQSDAPPPIGAAHLWIGL